MRMPVSRTIADLIDEMAARYPEREAVIGGGTRTTYAELRAETRDIAKGLHDIGIRRGDKVALLMGNRPEWLLSAFAITLLGATMVSVNTWATARELEYQLHHSDARTLILIDRFLGNDYLAMVRNIGPGSARLPLLEHIICLSESDHAGTIAFTGLRVRGAAIADADIDAAQAAVVAEDVAYLLYTSGSTSTPKGVQLQHFALIENMWSIGERQHLSEADRVWLAVPLFWGFGCENALFAVLTHGGSFVLQERFDAGVAMELIESERCTVLYATPNMVLAIAEHPDRPARDLSSLRTGATLGTPAQLRRAIDLVPEICNVYGLTETYANSNVTDGRDPIELRTESIGKALPGTEIVIADPATHARLPEGAVGEIKVKGYVTVGYYKDADKNAAAFDADGYFLTGDLGLLDAEGRLFFRGRLKEMVKTGGINVAPVEVEEILASHPAVDQAYVVGVPDAERDEILGAVIVLAEKDGVGPDELRRFCRESLAAYKVPRAFRFVGAGALPLTSTGKLQKNRLVAFFEPAEAAAAGEGG